MRVHSSLALTIIFIISSMLVACGGQSAKTIPTATAIPPTQTPIPVVKLIATSAHKDPASGIFTNKLVAYDSKNGQQLWSTDLPSGPYGSYVGGMKVQGHMVYLMSTIRNEPLSTTSSQTIDESQIIAYTDSGEKIWSYALAKGLTLLNSNAFIVTTNAIITYLIDNTTRSTVIQAVDKGSGEKIWDKHNTLDTSISQPSYSSDHPGTIYYEEAKQVSTQQRTYALIGFDTKSGAEVFRLPLVDAKYGFEFRTLGNIVIALEFTEVNSSSRIIMTQYNLTDSSQNWSLVQEYVGAVNIATITQRGTLLAFYKNDQDSTNDHLQFLDNATGKTIWTISNWKQGRWDTSFAMNGLLNKSSDHLALYSQDTGNPIWAIDNKLYISNVILITNVLYIGYRDSDNTDHLGAFDSSTGTMIWSVPTPFLLGIIDSDQSSNK